MLKLFLRNCFLIEAKRGLRMSAIINKNVISNLSFTYEINKFNDVHIKSKSILKFNEDSHSNSDTFESILKSQLLKCCLF